MRTINDIIIQNVASGMTNDEAQSYACQEIILSKISSSPFADNVLLKGGVVMFNETHNIRRTTRDLDFDFIRYDISEKSIKNFISLLNKSYPEFSVKYISIDDLRQDDYKGKRVVVLIKDKTRQLRFKMDIGVHTLLSVEQKTSCFVFENGDNQLFLKVNPPEQIVAEKLYSLAKHGVLSSRFKDIFDIYYFIEKKILNREIIKECLNALLLSKKYNLSSLEDVCSVISTTFEDKDYIKNFDSSNDGWIDTDREVIFKGILDYIYSL